MTEQSPAGSTLPEVVVLQTEQVEALRHVSETLAQKIDADVKSRERTRRVYLVIAAVLVPILVGVAVLVVRLNVVANGNRSLQKQNQQVLDFIADCTDPDGACAKRGNDQVSRAVEEIIKELDRLHPQTH